ncbi:MAG: hypothetical protein JO122_05250, partial [Acetobacteraceae bacterium]|nr:hypothetical protein [Acetobacteraceae bacterium]
MRELHLATLVWGQPYLGLFLDWHLPTLLAQGNVSAMQARKRFFIYTTIEEAQAIQGAPIFNVLASLAETVVFVQVGERPGDLAGGSVGRLMGQCQRDAIARAWSEDAGLCWTFPDTLFADGSFASVDRHIRAGGRAALANGLCARIPEFFSGLSPDRHPTLSLPPRDLLRRALGCLHPFSLTSMWASPLFTTHPAAILWPAADAGLVQRCWHLNPVFVYPRRQAANFGASLDGDFLELAVDYEDCAFLDDSDAFLLLELAEDNKPCLVGGAASIAQAAHWVRNWCRPINLRLALHPFRFHLGD